jgi:hypothetical protein
MNALRQILLFPLVACVLFLSGCTGMYRKTMEVALECIPDELGRISSSAPVRCRETLREYAALSRFSYALFRINRDK